jgi:hypothetical protein
MDKLVILEVLLESIKDCIKEAEYSNDVLTIYDLKEIVKKAKTKLINKSKIF